MFRLQFPALNPVAICSLLRCSGGRTVASRITLNVYHGTACGCTDIPPWSHCRRHVEVTWRCRSVDLELRDVLGFVRSYFGALRSRILKVSPLLALKRSLLTVLTCFAFHYCYDTNMILTNNMLFF